MRSCSAIVLLCAAGCGGGGDVALHRPAYARPAAVLTSGSLLAASDDTPSIIPRLIRPPEEPGPSRRAVVERPPRLRKFGLRVGFLSTLETDQGAWNPGVTGGLYYRGVKRAASRSVFEVGVDYTPVESDNASVSSTLYSLRGELLFGRWNAEARRTSVYFLGGADVVSEQGEQILSGSAASNLASGINVGLGIGSTRGAWDLRAVYTHFVGSENVKGNVLVAAGFSF